MFSDIAQQLIRIMGYDGSKTGVIPADEIDIALTKLQDNLQNIDVSMDSNNDEPGVSIKQRAFPLIELLKAAAKDKCFIKWEVK